MIEIPFEWAVLLLECYLVSCVLMAAFLIHKRGKTFTRWYHWAALVGASLVWPIGFLYIRVGE